MKFIHIRLLSLAFLFLLCLALVGCVGGGGVSDTTAALGEETTAPMVETTAETPETRPSTEEPETEHQTMIPDTAPPETDPPETEPPVVDVPIGATLDAPHATQFKVSNVFASDMVVQRGEFIRVWGWADASQNGKKVTGEFKGMFSEAMIQDGAWEITFTARLEASAELGHTMRIYGDGVSYAFSDVLVGDVYIVAGQSNCAYTMANHHTYINDPERGGKEAMDYTAPIRLHYNGQHQTAGYPKWGTEEVCLEVRSGTTWQKADSYGDIYNFTALGYLFAHNYLSLTDGQVPIGLIEIDGNGRPLGAFMCNEVADAMGTDRYNSSSGYYVTSGVNGDAGRYLYNHYMYPFERYAIAGLIWYQGESDFLQPNAKVYAQNFAALMTYMRGTHNLIHKDFPVFFVEFPTIYQRPAGFKGDWHYMDVGLIRAVMGSIPRILPNSHQIVSTDLWSDSGFFNNLHPNCKFEQSQRLATLAAALKGEGGKTVVQGNGPILVSMEVSEDGKTAILTYANVGEGLTTTDGGTLVKGFALYRQNCSLNRRNEVTATITGVDQITVKGTTNITGLAYNAVTDFVYGEDVNLCNSEGVPAGATVILPPEE